MGMVEKTEYSQALKDAFQEIDEYKKCIDELAVTILITVQKNPYYRNINDPKMRCSPPAGNDPYEELETLLRENETALGTFSNYQPTVASFKKLGELHREYLYRSRKAVHNMRSFINHYYWIIGIERKDLFDHYYLVTATVFLAAKSAVTASTLSVCLLQRRNKRLLLLTKACVSNTVHRLSIRYQLEENVRALAMILKMISALASFTLIACIIAGIPLVLLDYNTIMAQFLLASFDLWIAIYILMIYICILCINDSWKEDVYKIFRRILRRPNTVRRAIKILKLSPEDERKRYFEYYMKEW